MSTWFPRGEFRIRAWSAEKTLSLIERKLAAARDVRESGGIWLGRWPVLRGRVRRSGEGGAFNVRVMPSGALRGTLTAIIEGMAETTASGSLVRYRARFSYPTMALFFVWSVLFVLAAVLTASGLRWEYAMVLFIPIPVWWAARELRRNLLKAIDEMYGWFGDRVVPDDELE